MSYQIEHLPQDRPATDREQWGFAIQHFLEDNWPYLLGIIIILVVFFYARYRARKRREGQNRRF